METQIHVPLGSPVIRKIPIFVDEHNVTQGAMKLIKQLRPAWDISNVKTKVPWDAKLADAHRMLGYVRMGRSAASPNTRPVLSTAHATEGKLNNEVPPCCDKQ